MYCAHQQWLIAPEIDYFWGEGDSLLVRAEIARDRPRVEVFEDSLRPYALPISSTRWNERRLPTALSYDQGTRSTRLPAA